MPSRFALSVIRHPWLLGGLRWILRTPLAGLTAQPLFRALGLRAWRRTLRNERPLFYPMPPRLPGEQAAAWPVHEALDRLLREPAPSRIVPLVQAYQSGQWTPTQVAEAFLQAWERSETEAPPLRAFTQVDPDHLRREARNATERYQHNTVLGWLDGVPVAIKDEFHLPPYRTHFGHGEVAYEPGHVSQAVRLLESAGAVLVGKANMHEFGIGVSGLNLTQGTARNPYHPRALPGGSSSGAAVAVAAGLVPLALAADAGGSIRIPAAFNGVYGLKPTFGRVTTAYAGPLTWSLGHIGPIAATALDAALALLYLAGPDAHDPATWHQPPLRFADWLTPHLHGVVVGVPRTWLEDLDPDVRTAFREVLHRMEDLGAEVRELTFPAWEPLLVAFLIIAGTELRANILRWLDRVQVPVHRLSVETQSLLAAVPRFRSEDYLKAAQWRMYLTRVLEDAFREVHVLLTPATPAPPPLVPERVLSQGELNPGFLLETIRFTFPANLSGHPALVLPVRVSASGLPVAVQLIGGYWQEDLLLRMARSLEAVNPQFPLQPPRRYPIAVQG